MTINKIQANEVAIIAYGSNLLFNALNPWQGYQVVVNRVCQSIGSRIIVSGLYQSKAWPDDNQPQFHNGVFMIATPLSPKNCLKRLHEIEIEFGRNRSKVQIQNEPRSVDLDLIAYGDVIDDGGKELILPHPRAHERGFVIYPLADIAPDWMHPVLKKTASQLRSLVTVGIDAKRVYTEV